MMISFAARVNEIWVESLLIFKIEIFWKEGKVESQAMMQLPTVVSGILRQPPSNYNFRFLFYPHPLPVIQ